MRSCSRRVHKRARKENSVSNGTKDEVPDVIVIEPSSSDSQQPKLSNNSESDDEEAEDEEPKTSSNNAAAAADDEEDEGEEREREELKRENHRKKKKKKNAAEERENLLHKFPMNRINKIVRSASSDDLRLTQEAVFLINKASEKFLDLFCEEAYDCSVQDHKNYIAYKNLSSIVCKQRRFDFLSDFIPEKLKIEDALEERKSSWDVTTL